MRKIINDPKNFVDEMVQGILAAHPEQLRCVNNDLRCLVRSDKRKPGKVGISKTKTLPPSSSNISQMASNGCCDLSRPIASKSMPSNLLFFLLTTLIK